MKKSVTAMAVLAAAGFTGLSMAPAAAVPFASCADAAAAGYGLILRGSPAYSANLDRDGDGRACEANGSGTGVTTPQVPGSGTGVTTPEVVTPTDTAGFDNCTEARAAGRVNIPFGDPAYAAHLDRDSDGIACEQAGDDEGETGTDVIVDYVPESWGNGGYNQVGQVPVGGADTGVTVETGNTVPGLAVAGGLTLAAAAGATVIARRRAAQS